MAAAKTVLDSGDPSALERLLVGRRIWVVVPPLVGVVTAGHTYQCRVLSFKRLLPAGPVGEGEPNSRGGHRDKHLIQIWTDPGGTRTLTVGSIRLKNPGRVDGALRRHSAAGRASE